MVHVYEILFDISMPYTFFLPDLPRLKENDLINLSFDMLLENASKPTKLPDFKFRLKSKSRSLPICKVDQDFINTTEQTWLESRSLTIFKVEEDFKNTIGKTLLDTRSLPICKVDPAFKNATEPTRLESHSLPILSAADAEEHTTDLTPLKSKCLPLWKVGHAVESTAEPTLFKSRSSPTCKLDQTRTVESNTQQKSKNNCKCHGLMTNFESTIFSLHNNFQISHVHLTCFSDNNFIFMVH